MAIFMQRNRLLALACAILCVAIKEHIGVRADNSFANNMVCTAVYDGDSIANISAIDVDGVWFTPPAFALNAFYVRILRYATDAARPTLKGHIAASSSQADLIKRLSADASMKLYANQVISGGVERTTMLTLADGTQAGVVRGDLNVKILARYLSTYAGGAKAQIIKLIASSQQSSLEQLVDAITAIVAQTGGDAQQQWLIISEKLKQPNDGTVYAVGPQPAGSTAGRAPVPAYTRLSIVPAAGGSGGAQGGGGTQGGSGGGIACDSCKYPTDLAQIQRGWQSNIVDHFYTLSKNELNSAVAGLGYVQEFEGSFLAQSQKDCSCAVPLYRSYNPKVYDHFYTTNANEHNIAIQKLGYNNEGIIGYCAPYQGACGATMPLYRFWRANRHDHFYTTWQANVDALLKLNDPNGWLPEGISCWAWPAASGTASC